MGEEGSRSSSAVQLVHGYPRLGYLKDILAQAFYLKDRKVLSHF